MNMFKSLISRWRKRSYLKKDFRVMLNSLRMWDSSLHGWIPVINGLPNSYGRMSVTTVYMTGHMDLMFVLAFRDNPVDFFSRPKLHLVLVFYAFGKGFWREDYSTLKDIEARIGTNNYEFLMTKAAISWSSVDIV